MFSRSADETQRRKDVIKEAGKNIFSCAQSSEIKK
jgi:hypothetical protein